MKVLREVRKGLRTAALRTAQKVERVAPDARSTLVRWADPSRKDVGSHLGGSSCYDPKSRTEFPDFFHPRKDEGSSWLRLPLNFQHGVHGSPKRRAIRSESSSAPRHAVNKKASSAAEASVEGAVRYGGIDRGRSKKADEQIRVWPADDAELSGWS